jgi:hypothetical protein
MLIWLEPNYRNAAGTEEFNKLYFKAGIGGIILESLGKTWRITDDEILNASNLDIEGVYEIGTIGGRPLNVDVEAIIKKPPKDCGICHTSRVI